MEDLIEQNMGLVLTVVNRFHPKDQNEKESFYSEEIEDPW